MRLRRRTIITLAIFAVIGLTSTAIVGVYYGRLPGVYLGIGRYTVKVELALAGELYRAGNVTYRGVEVGRIKDVHLTATGVEAVVQLNSRVPIPADTKAEVHSRSAIGEQAIDLVPRSGKGPLLKNGDVIPRSRTSVPQNLNSLLELTNRGLNAIPRDDLKTVVDESYIAIGGLGPELSRLFGGGATLAIDARRNVDAFVTLIEETDPILDSQTESASSVRAWALHLADLAKDLETAERNELNPGPADDKLPGYRGRADDKLLRFGAKGGGAFSGALQKVGPAFARIDEFFRRLEPGLPPLVANLNPVGDVGLTYRDSLEALLALFPQLVADSATIILPDMDAPQRYRGLGLSFNLNLNFPPPCVTGFYPPQQQRSTVFEDSPPIPPGFVYCRIPQDSFNDIRGARNYPCVTRPGKRAATVGLCESDQPYIPLNDGYNWRGDANATLTGQGVPQFDPGETIPPGYPGGPPLPAAPPPPAAPAAPPPSAAVEYDPATGEYVGPDGKRYRQSSLAPGADKERTWQQMLMPPTGN
jgi:phospholipid/cholesterol/gamma-HCH transport system substrate-binding protein